MKRFLYKTAWLLLPIVVLSIPLDFLLSSTLRQSNGSDGECEVFNDIYNGKANCDIAIYGSSRAWVHINPQILEDSLKRSAYNFGMDGHNFWLQYMRHLELLKYNSSPGTIILSVDAFTLQKRKDLFRQNQFLPFMLWNNTIRTYTSSYQGYKNLDYYIPLIRYYGKKEAIETAITMLFTPDTSDRYRYKGYKGMDRIWNDDLNKAKEKMRSYEIKLDTPSVQLFERFVGECQQSGIELIMVYTPEYIEGQKFMKNRQDIINMYSGFSTKYGIKFLDYSNDEICYNKDLFYNALHLNYKGANLFTQKMVSDIKHNRHVPL